MNPTIPTTLVPTPSSSGASSFYSSPQQPAWMSSQKATPGTIDAMNGKPLSSPTVMTDSNIRESVIPDVRNKSNNFLGQGAPAPTDVNAGKKDGSSSMGSSYEDLFNGALGSESVKGIGTDPITSSILQSIKDMQMKSDASTAAQLEGIHAGFQAREALLKESQESTSGLLKGLLMTDGSYRTGSGVSLVSAKERADVQGLTNLANEELAAKATIYKAKQDSDFQLMDKANTLLENIQTKKQALAGKIADAITTKNKEDRAYNLEVERFNHEVDKDEKTQAREDLKLKQGEYEFRDLKDEFGNTIGTQVFSRSNPTKPISVVGAPGTEKPGVNGIINPVQLNADGTPNKNQQEQALLAIPASMRGIVQDLANYIQNPAGLSKKGNSAAVLKSYASTINPNFHEDYYNEIAKIRADYTSGKTSQNIKSLNTSINHAGDLAKDFASLPNTDITKYNSIKNWFKTNTGSGDPTKVINDLNALGGELAKTYKGTAGTDTEIANIEKGINVNSSPAQFKAFIESSMNLLGGRLNALEEGYLDPGGNKLPDSHSLLQPTTLKVLTNLKDKGWDIQVPGVLFSDKNAFLKANPVDGQEKLKTAFDHLKSAGVPTTPENIMQYAQSI